MIEDDNGIQPEKRMPAWKFLATKLRNVGGWDLWKSFLICASGAFISYLIHAAWGKYLLPAVDELLLHIATAFLVAGILTITIEYNARKRTETETREFGERIAQNVFQGLLTHIVPREIFDEINSLLRAQWVRKDCEYTITFDRPYPEMPSDYFVIRRELSFTVKNLTTQKIVFPVRSKYSAHPDRTPEAWQRKFHVELEVNRDKIANMDSYLSRTDEFISLEYPLTLGPEESAFVYLSGEEPSRTTAGSNSYTQGTTAIGIRIDIKNLYPDAIKDVAIFMHHPAQKDTVRRADRYTLNRAFLPGQGFEIRWRTVKAATITTNGS